MYTRSHVHTFTRSAVVASHCLKGGGLVQMEGGHVQILPFLKHIFCYPPLLPPLYKKPPLYVCINLCGPTFSLYKN